MGIDSGDATWRWFYGQRNWGTEKTKDLSVRFNGDGRVKTYSFTSNFPDDMRRDSSKGDLMPNITVQ